MSMFKIATRRAETMKLKDYLKLKKVKPYKWAAEVGLPKSGVYAWLTGKLRPNIVNIMAIKTATDGAVGPEDWV
jgi:hypothetical protein